MDLPPLSPLSSMYDPRSPCASSKAGSTPSDDDLPRRRSSSTVSPPSTPSSSNALCTSLDSASGGSSPPDPTAEPHNQDHHHQQPGAHQVMQRVSSVMSLDIPTGKAETLPHNGPPPRPATPSSARLPRSRVFIKHPSARSSLVDPVPVGPPPDAGGESRLVTRYLARPASPSPLVRRPAIASSVSSNGVLTQRQRGPVPMMYNSNNNNQANNNQVNTNYIASHLNMIHTEESHHYNHRDNEDNDHDDDFYFSDEEHQAPPSTSQDVSQAPHSLQTATTPVPLPPALQSTGMAAAVVNGTDAYDPHGAHRGMAAGHAAGTGMHGMLDSALSSKVRRAVSALRSISFQTAAPEDVDTAWGQAAPSCTAAAKTSKQERRDQQRNQQRLLLQQQQQMAQVGSSRDLVSSRRSDVHPPPPARRRVRPPITASRWRRPRGRISSKHGVQSYDCYSEADVRSRRMSEDIPPPPRSIVMTPGTGEHAGDGGARASADTVAAAAAMAAGSNCVGNGGGAFGSVGGDMMENGGASSRAPSMQVGSPDMVAMGQPSILDAQRFYSVRETGVVAAAEAGSAAAVVRRETVRDGPQRRSAPVRHSSPHRSLWGGRRDGGSNRAAQLLLSNGGQSLLAAATTGAAPATKGHGHAMVTIGDGGVGGTGAGVSVSPVDKYVEFIQASAQSGTAKPKARTFPGRGMNRAQAVLRR